MVRDQIYFWSPIFLQNQLVSSYGRRLKKQRYGRDYSEALQHYSEKPYVSLESEKSVQLAELRRLLMHAVDKSKFHNELYSGIDVSRIRSLEDLQRLPVVDKELLRKNIDSVYTLGSKDAIEAFTGGTTGKSLRVLYTKEDFQKRMAYLDAFKARCGVDPHGSSKATFSGRAVAMGFFQGKRKIFWRDNRAYKQRLYSTFDLSPKNIPSYIENLNQFAPDLVNGFVSAIHQIAEYSLRNDIPITFKPNAIFTTSETLLPFHRATIEKAFGAKIFDQYASAEGAPFVTECSEGNMHYNIDTGVIETQDFGHGPEMLVTSFTTYGTPLIRYRIGDSLSFKDGMCPCGHCHPLVERIEGRNVDYLLSAERGRVSLSHLADVIKGLPNCVEEMQFIQRAPEEITIRVVVDDSSFDSNAEAIILRAMVYRFGKATRFNIDRVDAIERDSSGKFSLIKNCLDDSTRPT